ncbi:MAG: sulfatase-like hydrolase/transferase [Planctomycetales bacterium]
MRFFLLLVGMLLSVGSAASAADGTPARPNIIFIVADDMGPWAWGGGGDPQALTPHLDRLAREGARLDHCYSPTPVCSPSRVAVLVSRYGTEVGITDWINPKSEPAVGLDPKYPAWPTFLKQAGYRTAMIGKWHLGTEDRFLPKHFGYDHFVGHRSSPLELRDPLLDVDNHTERRSGFVADVFTDAAIRFVRKDLHQPFAISLHFREPHRPWLPLSIEDYKPFEKLDSALPQPQHPLLDVAQVKKIMPEYLAAIACIDRNVGRLLAVLDQDKIADNTLFIFTSDHGYNVGHHGILHKGNGEWILTTIPPSTNPNIPAKRA